MNENMYNSAIFFTKEYIEDKRGTHRVNFYKNNDFFKIFDFFIKFQILPFFCRGSIPHKYNLKFNS